MKKIYRTKEEIVREIAGLYIEFSNRFAKDGYDPQYDPGELLRHVAGLISFAHMEDLNGSVPLWQDLHSKYLNERGYGI